MPERRWIVAVVVALLAGVGLTGCGDDEVEDDAAVVEDEEVDADVLDLADDEGQEVFTDPQSFVGEEVTISGEVEEVQTDAEAFRIEVRSGAGEVPVEDEILTVFGVSGGVAEAVEPGEVVQVIGTLREFDPQATAEELGVQDLPPALASKLVPGDFVIVADEVNDADQ